MRQHLAKQIIRLKLKPTYAHNSLLKLQKNAECQIKMENMLNVIFHCYTSTTAIIQGAQKR